jgi:hypothetical protein
MLTKKAKGLIRQLLYNSYNPETKLPIVHFNIVGGVKKKENILFPIRASTPCIIYPK